MAENTFTKFTVALVFVVSIVSRSNAQEVSIASTSITNADTVTYIAGGTAQTITITLGLSETGGASTAGSVTKMAVYFTDNVQYESSTSAGTSIAFEKTFTSAIPVTAGSTDDKTLIADETIAVTLDEAKCADYTHVCVVITATGDTDATDDDGCLPFGATVGTGAGTKQCTEVTVASTSITNADTVTYLAGGAAQTITVTLGLTVPAGGGDGSITKMAVYFTDNAQYETSTPAKTSSPFEKTFTTAITVPAGSTDIKTFIAAETIDVTIDEAKCADYTHVCVVITTGDTTAADDDGCLPFGATVGTGAGTKQCTAPGVKADSFSATAPETYTIDTTTPVEFTFSIGLTNADASNIICTGVNIYLSDNEALTTKSTAVPAAGVTFPLTIDASADGSTLTPGLTASITADTTQCSSYKYLCAQVMPGNAIGCFSVSENIDCQGSTGHMTVASFALLCVSIAAAFWYIHP